MTTSWWPRLKGGGRHSQPNDQVEAKRCEKFDVSAPVMAVVIIAMDFQQQLIRRRPGSRLEQSNNYHLVHSLSSSSANNDSNNATRHEFGVPLSPFCGDGLFEAPRNNLARGLAWVHLKAEEKTRFLTFPMIAQVAKRLSGALCGAIVRFLKTKCQILENGTQCANITFSGLIFCCDSVWKLDFTSLFLKWFESKQIPVNYK